VNNIKIGLGSFPITGIQPSYCPSGKHDFMNKKFEGHSSNWENCSYNVLGIKGAH
jgi:hypothetical protein